MITETFQLRHVRAQQPYQRNPHFHDVNELLFTLNDNSTMLLNQNTYAIQSGTLTVISQGTLHQKFNNQDAELDSYTIHYAPGLLKELSTASCDLYKIFGETSGCFHLNQTTVSRIYSMLQQIDQLSDDRLGNDLRKIALFMNILLETLPQISQANSVSRGSYFRDDAQLAPILSFIDNHLTEPLSLEGIAQAFYTSKYTLCHMFKKKTGLTLITYINMNRIRLACMLIKGGRSVAETSAMCGFNSTEHFIRTFTSFVGITPGKYAQKLSLNQNVPIHLAIFSPKNE